MDLEKNKQRLEILAAQIEELKRNGGGGTPTESDDFTPDNITIEDGGTFPSGSTERLTKHLPLEINDTLYYFLEETGVDYLYGSLPTSGAFPTITYFRVMKGSFTVEFHQTAIDTAPTEDSDNLITSGGVYTALQSAGGGDVIVSGDNVKTINAVEGVNGILIGNQAGFNSPAAGYKIAIGIRAGSIRPNGCPIAIGYQSKSSREGVVIGSQAEDNSASTSSLGSVIIGGHSTANSDNNAIVGNYLNATADGQVILGRYNETSNIQNCFIVGNGTSNQARSNLFSFSNNLFYCGNDTTGYDLRYFAPADETLTDGGTISATALANALKHVPLSFNAHVCYYSYEDTNNVYYTSTRLNGASLHTNVVAINKTTGVATFNEFDQS